MKRIYKINLQKDIPTLPPETEIHAVQHKDKINVTIKAGYNKVYGMGERFDRVEQKGMNRDIKVVEKFCNQGELSYCPVPFFFTDSGFGVYLDILAPAEFDFKEQIQIQASSLGKPVLYLFYGSPEEIITGYYEVTGKPKLPPKWCFGLWMSANRWNSQHLVTEQVALAKQHDLPASVLVLEAWSDEATFYLWNEGKWNDPGLMIKQLRDENIRLILWQTPVFKKLDDGQLSEQHLEDCRIVKEKKLCAMKDGEPYTIPEGNWFSDSMIPDFTNPDAVKFWFSRRQYLLEMGVAGFKTDGGEFIYDDSARFYNGSTGFEMKNGYAQSYVKAYAEFIGEDRILFSRAGYSGQQNYPCQWAGDQQSTWEEFKHVITAGLSAGLSGIPYWGFDIAGFAGPLPSIELYERATQLAVFAPIMQWHSELVGGQFAELMPSAGGINDRSPWNMAAVYNDTGLIERIRFHTNLRYNLLPYLYNCAIISSEKGLPMMKHLLFEYPDDPNVFDINDCFMLGDILVAPVLESGLTSMELYLPGMWWTDLWSGKRYEGGKKYIIKLQSDRTPAFIRDGGCLVLNLGSSKKLGSCVCNDLNTYVELCAFPAGTAGSYRFKDDLGNDILIEWKDGSKTITRYSGEAEITALLLLN